jgi:DnaJ homolog subfamily B member 4
MGDPYQILGVSRGADDEEIKKAYRKMSLRYHPDRNTDADAKEKFQEISNAYETIKTAELRQQFDSPQPQNPFGPGGPGGMGGGDFHDINNMFNMMFGGGFPGMGGGGVPPGIRIFHSGGPGNGMEFNNLFQQMNKPPPIFKNVEISLKQCYDGCAIPVEIERWVMEAGNVRNTQHETIYVNIPAGMEESEFVLIQERGNIVNEHLKGDIKIGVRIVNDTQFERMGLDLLYKKTVTLKEALCGFGFEIRHLNDKTLSIHNKTSVNIITPGYRRVFPQMGMKRNGTIGNLIVEFQVKFPEKLTEEQTAILMKCL